MSMTDQCPHGALLGACVYCAMGSKKLDDVNSIVEDLIIKDSVNQQMDQMYKFQMYMAQRDIFLAAMHKITDYVQKNNIKIGDQDCDDCNRILMILNNTIQDCIKLEKERKSKN